MLTQQEIEQNKQTVISTIQALPDYKFHSADAKIALLRFLDNGFYTAPASTRYYGSYEGGLAEYFIKLYNNLYELVRAKGYSDVYSKDEMVIVALGSIIYKTDFYEFYTKNEKIYSPKGGRRDEKGTFDWISKQVYRVKDDRFSIGTNEESSLATMTRYFKLENEEMAAILSAGLEFTDAHNARYNVYFNYPIVSFLHCASVMTSFVDYFDAEVLFQ